MRKWVILCTFLVIILIWQLALSFVQSNNKQDELQSYAIKRTLNETEIISIDYVSFYHGEKAYQVVVGKDKNNETSIAWISDDPTKDLFTLNQNEGLTKTEVKEHVIKERDPLVIKEIRLGMENDKPLWEVTYIDKEQRFTYYYLDFKSGEFLKRYSLKQQKLKGEF